MAALEALSALPPFDPVARVDYRSEGRLLVLADVADTAVRAARALNDDLAVAVLWTGAADWPGPGEVEAVPGQLLALKGYLGAFELAFQPVGGGAQAAPFDLVLDLRAQPAFDMHQPPQGYFHATDETTLAAALAELPGMVGEFEKPRFFDYRESLCAHSRSRKPGCDQCIDVCSTRAISADGDRVQVDPHLCMGCGACAAVCPSGAMSYQYPRVADRGVQLKTLLGAFRLASRGEAGAPVVLFHNATDGRELLAQAGADIPVNVLPLEAWHVAAIGLDVMMGAIAYGAGHVAVLAAGSEAPQYLDALAREMALGESILHGLGYTGTHFSVVRDAPGLAALAPAATVPVPAGFNLSNDKRGTLEFCIEHFLRHAPQRADEIPLPAGSLFGRVTVDAQKCTLCLACAGACPASALMDGGEYPRLHFIERNCVQCGLCESTCPENAIALTPRLLLTPQRKATVVLHEAEPFNCISCGKALGAKPMIDNLLSKLAGHSMFQGEGQLKRLQMCADCRVVDMMSNPHEVSILTGRSAP